MFSVYSVAVDTLFLCLLEDLETNDGSVARPYYMTRWPIVIVIVIVIVIAYLLI